jgi:hypothetical protein
MTVNKSGVLRTLMVGIAVALTLSSTTQRLIFAADWERESRSASVRIDELRRQNELLKSRVDGFEERLGFLAAASVQGPSRVQSPFEVVDHSGQIIFQVTGDPGTTVPSRGRVQIARGSLDNFVLTIRRPNGDVSAAIAEAKNGVGSLQLRDGSGNERIRVEGDGGVRLLGPKGESVAGFGFKDPNAARGLLQLGGVLKIFDDAGNTVVEAGTAPSGVGVVRVGPGLKCVPYAGLRVPECIMGRP